MTALQRVKSGEFSLENSINEQDLLSVKNLEDLLIKPDSILTFDKINLTKSQSVELYNGRPFDLDYKDGTYSVYDSDNEFVGVGFVTENRLKIKAFIKDL